jgi:hypothetical protein
MCLRFASLALEKTSAQQGGVSRNIGRRLGLISDLLATRRAGCSTLEVSTFEHVLTFEWISALQRSGLQLLGAQVYTACYSSSRKLLAPTAANSIGTSICESTQSTTPRLAVIRYTSSGVTSLETASYQSLFLFFNILALRDTAFDILVLLSTLVMKS